jgi:hypothetical protein
MIPKRQLTPAEFADCYSDYRTERYFCYRFGYWPSVQRIRIFSQASKIEKVISDLKAVKIQSIGNDGKSRLAHFEGDDFLLMIGSWHEPYAGEPDEEPAEVVDLPNQSVPIDVFSQSAERAQQIAKTFDSIKETQAFRPKISMVARNSHGYYLREFELPKVNFDLALHYGGEFLTVHWKLMKCLKESDKGIAFLHGEPGTGKTTYIRYLINQVQKKVIFLPPYLTDFISSPEFIPFVAEHPKSVWIIEDAESVVMKRQAGSSQGISNILNISDGILGDCFKCQIVATFNTARAQIDEALLRKGRLIVEHQFGKLDVPHSQKLLDSLKIKHKATEGMSLAEIFNFTEPEFKKERLKHVSQVI